MDVDDGGTTLPSLMSDQDMWKQGMDGVQGCMDVPQEWPRGPMQFLVAVPAQRSRHCPQSPRQRPMCRASMSVSWQKCSPSDDSVPDIPCLATLATDRVVIV